MQAQSYQQFIAGDRVTFQYAQGAVLRGTIEGWTDKYTAYMLHADTGRKLLVPPGCLRPEASDDPARCQEREKDWPSYVVYLMTSAGCQEVWGGKARTPREAFVRAGKGAPVLQEILRCKTYKRLNARRKYPIGPCGELAYCEKVDGD
jgi:hypothetical protein